MLTEPLAYTDAEVSSLLRISKRTVYRLRKSGVLRSIRIGRAVRVPADALTQFLESIRGREKMTATQSGGMQ